MGQNVTFLQKIMATSLNGGLIYRNENPKGKVIAKNATCAQSWGPSCNKIPSILVVDYVVHHIVDHVVDPIVDHIEQITRKEFGL